MKHSLFVFLSIIFLFDFNQDLFGQTGTTVKVKMENLTTDAQESYKIVFQVASDDTLVHKSLMRQLGNITSVDPHLKIEVVCHGPGIDLLHKEKSHFGAKVKDYVDKGITFNACEFTLKQQNISKDQIIPEAKFVRSALLHIVKLQTEGWSYIKSGF
ncbi:MAG TPA: DsrE family protein [Saprospiraceae bacterium]|nr:DsrE family protein [Saprospiraceae bacterium]